MIRLSLKPSRFPPTLLQPPPPRLLCTSRIPLCMPKRWHSASPPSSIAASFPGTPTKRRQLSPRFLSTTANMPSPTTPTIALTPREETLRQLLVDCAAHIDSTTPSPAGPHPPDAPSTPLTLRFTGGWVRDRLLRGQSQDIDVGINKMTGYEFAQHLVTFIAAHGPKYGIDSGARSIHKIESNPEKSKHLETATTRILDFEVDLVNLRSEAYGEDSRIPVVMEFGTPEQDALRRDATVNALFYNLHTGLVEDFTGQGLDDLGKRLIRTPLKPWETFHDDPLRVLRLIRFASRLDFEIVPEVQEAMRDEEIKRDLRIKISRERVRTEVEKMLKGRDPHHSLSLIHSLNLTPSIFSPPLDPPPELPWGDILPAITLLKYLFTPTTPPSNTTENLAPLLQDPYTAYLLASFVPWRGLFEGSGAKRLPSAAVAAREGLRATNKELAVLGAVFTNLGDVADTVEKNKQQGGLSRVEAGRAVRRWGGSWRSQVLGSLVVRGLEAWNTVGGLNTSSPPPPPPPEVQEVIAHHALLVSRIYTLGVDSAHELKPVVNGTQLCAVLGRKPGTWMKGALERVVDWQLEFPGGGREGAEGFVRGLAGGGEV